MTPKVTKTKLTQESEPVGKTSRNSQDSPSFPGKRVKLETV